jgi:RNA polymerase sigma factor (sigma-70 family)
VNPTEAVTEIVRAIKRGQAVEQNFALLYRRFYASVYSFFRGKNISPQEAQELTQETFFSVFINLHSLRQDEQFAFWLIQVARRTLSHRLEKEDAKKRKGHTIPFDPFGVEEPDQRLSPAAGLSDSTQNPQELLLEKERMQKIREAIQQLPEQARRCLELRVDGGLQYQQIALVLGVSPETVKSHLHQARKSLRQLLGEHFRESDF